MSQSNGGFGSSNGGFMSNAGTATAVSAEAFPLFAPSGAVGAPSYSFSGDNTSGIFFDSGVGVKVVYGGVLGLTVGATYVSMAKTIDMSGATKIRGSGGSATACPFQPSGDAGMGMYSDTSDVLGFAVNDAACLTFDVNQVATFLAEVNHTQTAAAGTNGAALAVNVPGSGAANQVGWIKCQVNGTEAYVPYWTAA